MFKLKLKVITDDFFMKDVFKKVIFHIHIIEFQKRKLSYTHILMILTPEDKLNSSKNFDNLVCTKISD